MRVCLPVFLLAACGNSSNPPATADGPDHSSDAPVHDAPGPDASSGTSSGLVTILSGHAGTTAISEVTAQFIVGDIYGTKLGSDGACTMYGNPPDAGISAGTIDITGTSAAVTLTAAGTPASYSVSPSPTPAPLFTAGATLTVNAAGAAFPAFSATVTAPAPLAGYTSPTSISRAAGYAATWTAGTGPSMWLLMIDVVSASDVDLLLCRIPDTGSYTVTPAALALFPAAATSVSVALARAVVTSKVVAGGSVDIVALATNEGGAGTTLAP